MWDRTGKGKRKQAKGVSDREIQRDTEGEREGG